MDLSVALIIAASFAILCTFHIGKRILTIDFSEYSSKMTILLYRIFDLLSIAFLTETRKI